LYVDATVGGGGHAAEILRRSGPDGRLIGIDRDPEALAAAMVALAAYGSRAELVAGNFAELGSLLKSHAGRVDGVLFDLGVSSPQIDRPDRGFSFQSDGRLDMRMGGSNLTAAAVVNSYSQARLAAMFREYGEERESTRIARAVVRQRQSGPIATTEQLAAIIRGTRPVMPAKTLARIFQAIRIEVNDELGSLRLALEQAQGLLARGGRMAVISYHSLEDRIVKQHFRDRAVVCTCPPALPVCACGRSGPTLRVVTPRPVVPDERERQDNQRSRSAKLRAAERT